MNYRFPRSRPLKFILAAVVVLIAVAALIPSWVQKWLWMRQAGYAGVFRTIWSIRWELFAAAFVVALLYLGINLRFAQRNGAAFSTGKFRSPSTVAAELGARISAMGLKLATGAIAVAAALVFAAIFYTQWDTFLRVRYGGSSGVSDPLFGVDGGFYLFRLPLYEILQSSLTNLAFVTLLAVIAYYAYFGLLPLHRGVRSEDRSAEVVPHLSIMALVLVANWGSGFCLDHFEVLYSTQGVVYGAGYTGDHVTRVAYWLMAGTAVALCALPVLNVFRPRCRTVAIGAGAYVALYVFAVMLLPALFQRFAVQPNELTLEAPYLTHNIKFARKAYSLDSIQETSYPALADLTSDVIARNQDTIQNVRLRDWRPLLQMCQQAQKIRLYYQYYHADVDRYHLPDGYQQAMLSARELSAEVPAEAQTWVNQKPQFTHGYGLVMSFVSKTIGGGFLYVVPVYLTAESTDFPQLKRVIVISGDEVAMEPTLDEAIQAVFGTQQPQTPGQAPDRPLESGQARAAFDKAQKAMEQRTGEVLAKRWTRSGAC